MIMLYTLSLFWPSTKTLDTSPSVPPPLKPFCCQTFSLKIVEFTAFKGIPYTKGISDNALYFKPFLILNDAEPENDYVNKDLRRTCEVPPGLVPKNSSCNFETDSCSPLS